MHALITFHNEKYQPLADLTWDQNRLMYAAIHGYGAHCKTDDFIGVYGVGLEKIHFTKHILENHPEYEWVWWTGTDTMITNFSTRIEDRINNNYHFIVSVDINGINADSYLVRNTPEGRGFIDDIISIQDEAVQHWDHEQWAMCNLLGFPGTGLPGWPFGRDLQVAEKYRNIVKLMPQRYMNGFNYKLYTEYAVHRDRLDFDGNWQFGDWLIHWPATNLETRIQLANYYKDYIIQ